MLLYTLTVACLLPQPVALAWAGVLRDENARLERVVEKLELDAMVKRYRAGQDVRVEGMGGQGVDLDGVLDDLRTRTRQQIRMLIREGRTSPEAFAELLARQALAKRVLEMENRYGYLLPGAGPFTDSRPGRPQAVDPDRFPELSKLIRKNRELQARKQRAEAGEK
jgi:hypothetical protein